jgi:hypothetical protein
MSDSRVLETHITFTDPSWHEAAAQKLLDQDDGGWVAVPLLDETKLGHLRERLLNQIRHAPEINPRLGKAWHYAKTGFGTLNVSSSFHNAIVRNLRHKADARLKHMFAEVARTRYHGDTDVYLEQIVDRVLIRQPGQTPTAEAWHRDESKIAELEMEEEGITNAHKVYRKSQVGALVNDMIFGGWINLNDFTEYLSAIPGTQLDNNAGEGFSTIKADQHQELNLRRRRLAVPPGHILVFFENMVHEVLPNPADERQMRLFTGFRISQNNSPFFPDVEDLLWTMSPMALKSGEAAHAYGTMTWSSGVSKRSAEKPTAGTTGLLNLQRWAEETFTEENLTTRLARSGWLEGQYIPLPRGPLLWRPIYPYDRLWARWMIGFLHLSKIYDTYMKVIALRFIQPIPIISIWILCIHPMTQGK